MQVVFDITMSMCSGICSVAKHGRAIAEVFEQLDLLRLCSAPDVPAASSYKTYHIEDEILQVSSLFLISVCFNNFMPFVCFQVISLQVQSRVQNDVAAALRDDRFISILLDESTDAGNISQLGITYRIAHFGEVTQMFAALIPMGISHAADAILTLVRAHLKGK